MIGEIRDRETMTAAISYALSGHLVLSTLHANNSYHALGRILSFYTPEARPALLATPKTAASVAAAAGKKGTVPQYLSNELANLQAGLARLNGGGNNVISTSTFA